jgi:glutamyl-tRNA synthetase
LQIHCNGGPQDLAGVEAVWSQQQRLSLYDDALEKLKAKGLVFACVCSRSGHERCDCRQKKLPLDQPGFCWRVITTDEPIAVEQADGTTIAARLPAEMKNVVVRRKDGLPAYQLASVVDDLHFGVDFIVRGEDLWPSTLAQLYLAAVLEAPAFSAIRFLHHPLLRGADGEKLSKSAGALSVKHWREAGKSRAEFLAYLSELFQAMQPVQSEENIGRALGL